MARIVERGLRVAGLVLLSLSLTSCCTKYPEGMRRASLIEDGGLGYLFSSVFYPNGMVPCEGDYDQRK